MSRERIRTSGDDATVRIPPEILEDLGLAVGDEVEIRLVERAVVVRRLDEVERSERIEAATTDVIEQRQEAYEELARGAD